MQKEYIEEEVVRWGMLSLADNTEWRKGALYEVRQDWVPEGYYQIKLCGIRKTLKPKVKQRKELDCIYSNIDGLIPPDAKIFAEWEE